MMRRAAAALLILWSCGCTTWRSHPPQSLSAIVQTGAPKIRVGTGATGRIVLIKPVLTGDTLFGVERIASLDRGPSEARHSVAVKEIVSVETHHISAVRTVAFLGLSGGVSLLLLSFWVMSRPGY